MILPNLGYSSTIPDAALKERLTATTTKLEFIKNEQKVLKFEQDSLLKELYQREFKRELTVHDMGNLHWLQWRAMMLDEK